MTPPTFRGSSAQASNAASFTIALPAGSVAGDTAYVIVAAGDNALSVTGFQHISSRDAAAGIGGGLYKKVLDAADITAGTVTVNCIGGFQNQAVMVVYQGTQTGVIYLDWQQAMAASVARYQNKNQVIPFQLTTADEVIFGLITRASTDMTVSIGTLLQNTKAANGSLAVYRYPVVVAGELSHSTNFPAAAFEVHQIRLVIRGS